MASLTAQQQNELGMLASLGAAMVTAALDDSMAGVLLCLNQAAHLGSAPEIEEILDRVESLLNQWNRELS